MRKLVHAKYFEAIIQLRPFRQDSFDYIMKLAKVRKDLFISEIKELRGGMDIYLSDRHFAKAVGKKLKQYFNSQVKYSFKLHTVSKTGENLYRTTVLVRSKE